jgi:hypothetical protein
MNYEKLRCNPYLAAHDVGFQLGNAIIAVTLQVPCSGKIKCEALRGSAMRQYTRG